MPFGDNKATEGVVVLTGYDLKSRRNNFCFYVRPFQEADVRRFAKELHNGNGDAPNRTPFPIVSYLFQNVSMRREISARRFMWNRL